LFLQEVAADAADIVASSPSTLQKQLAQQGEDLERDWAEAEQASGAALTTTGGTTQPSTQPPSQPPGPIQYQ